MLKYIEIEVPDIGDFNNSPISRVLVSEGDEVALDAPLITVKKRRKTLDIPSPTAGKVFELLVDVGDPMAQGTSILVMETVVPDHQPGTTPSSEKAAAPLADEVAQVAASLEPDSQGPEEAQGSFDFSGPENQQDTAEFDPGIDEIHTAKTSGVTAPKPLGETLSTDRLSADGDQTPTSPNLQNSPVDTAPIATQATNGEPVPETKPTATEVIPDIGDFDTVEVIEVHIGTGDKVEIDDPLVTLESDKASMAVPATFAGEIVEVLLEVGDKVSRGVEIVRLLPTAPAIAEKPVQGDDHPDIEPLALPSQRSPAASSESPVAAPSSGVDTGVPTPPSTLPPPTGSQPKVPHASPAVRLFSRELGVDLSQVQGSGRNDRILVEDVQSYVRKRLANGDHGVLSTLPGLPQVDFSRFGPIENQPMGRIRKRAAANLYRAWLNIPHVTHHDLADITTLDAFRLEMKEEAAAAGVRLTMLAFVLKACAVVLQRHPTFNASLNSNGDNLVLKKYYHIGVAVDTADGLVVPVIRDVDKKGIYELANDLAAASARARDQQLQASDMEGASFTVSSLGGVGGIAFTPIVNAPEVAILGLSRASLKPVYMEGAFVARLMLPLSLSYDHRAIDGAQAARFAVDLAKILGDTRRILL